MERRYNFKARMRVLPTAMLLALSCGSPALRGAGYQVAAPAGSGTRALANGIYLVLREAATQEGAPALGAHQAGIIYDGKYTDAQPPDPPQYVVIDTAAFVPLILAGPPEARKDGKGWTLLSVTLAREHVKKLEDFTTEHLGGKVAIVLEGEIVTLHKIRSVIREGKAQITRCNDNACQVLLTKLSK